MRCGLALSVLLTSCAPTLFATFEEASIRCASDLDCPDRGRCLVDRCLFTDSPCAVDAGDHLDALPEGEACVRPGDTETRAICVIGDCLPSVCGDGLVDARVGEVCDAGDGNSDLLPGACRKNCQPARCGDDVTDPNEACDGSAGCLSNCTINTCGDGAVSDGIEQCDDGNGDEGDACRSNCTLNVCGDGVIRRGIETCEEDNATEIANSADGCDQCQLTTLTASLVTGLGDRSGTTGYIVDMALDRDGYLFFSDQSRLYQVAPGTRTAVAIAGRADLGFSGDGGPAGAAQIQFSTSFAIDGSGAIHIFDTSRLRRIDRFSRVITTIAGRGVEGFDGDFGPALSGTVSVAGSMAFDPLGNLYFAKLEHLREWVRDTGHLRPVPSAIPNLLGVRFHGGAIYAVEQNQAEPDPSGMPGYFVDSRRVHRVDPDTGNSVLVAGSDIFGSDADGICSKLARLTPRAITFSNDGAMYLAEVSRIRKITPSVACDPDDYGIVTSLSAASGDAGDGRPLAATFLDGNRGIDVDPQDRLYILQSRSIRRVELDGTVSTFVGNGRSAPPVLNTPGTALDAGARTHFLSFADDGRLYFTRESTNEACVYDPATHTVTALAEKLSSVSGIARAPDGTVYVADPTAAKVYRILAGGVLDPIIVGPTVTNPQGLAVSADGTLWVADPSMHQVVRWKAGSLLTSVGSGADGTAGESVAVDVAELNSPRYVTPTPGGMLIQTLDRLRLVAAAEIVSTYALGLPTDAGQVGISASSVFYIPQSDGVVHVSSGTPDHFGNGDNTFAGDGGPAENASLSIPLAATVDQNGDVYVSQMNPNIIRRVDAVSGTISSVVGDLDIVGIGPFASGQLGAAQDVVAVDDDILVTSQRVDGGRLLRAALAEQRIDGVLGYDHGYEDGAFAWPFAPATPARYSRFLASPTGLAHDAAARRLYVAEAHGIRMVVLDGRDPATWRASTLSGNALPGYVDGAAARFFNPAGLAFDPVARALYIADESNHVIRRLSVDSGMTTTVAGVALNRGYRGDGGDPLAAELDSPRSVAVGPIGELYIADTGNHRVRMVRDGTIHTVAGTGDPTVLDSPMGLHTDAFGNLFIASGATVRRVKAGPDGRADSDDAMSVVFAGNDELGLCPTGITETSEGLMVMDRCRGLLVKLLR